MNAPAPHLPDVPVIETARLRLRGHTVADHAAMVRMWSDPQVTRFVGNRVFTPEECWTRLLRYLGHWCALGYGYWVVEERATGAFVGEAGFADYRRDTEPPTELAPEAGWVLASGFHGKGYATEIATALVAWGHSVFGDRQLRCIIDPAHAASLRVAEKCGFVPEGTLHYKNGPAVLLIHPGRPASEGSI